MAKTIVISTAVELMRFAPADFAYAKADGNYTVLTLIDGCDYTFAFNLQHLGELFESQLGIDAATFIRIGKSLIVNRQYVMRIIPAKQQLVLATPGMAKKYALSASKEALKQIKLLYEAES